jgi:hypothetical protein
MIRVQPLPAIIVLVTALSVAACTSENRLLESKQDIAFQTAMSRARFEMDCPEVTGTLLSRSVVQPVRTAPRAYGPDWGTPYGPAWGRPWPYAPYLGQPWDYGRSWREPLGYDPAWSSTYGVPRAEYMIAVNGCEQRKTLVVICPYGGAGCLAGEKVVSGEVERNYAGGQ